MVPVGGRAGSGTSPNRPETTRMFLSGKRPANIVTPTRLAPPSVLQAVACPPLPASAGISLPPLSNVKEGEHSAVKRPARHWRRGGVSANERNIPRRACACGPRELNPSHDALTYPQDPHSPAGCSFCPPGGLVSHTCGPTLVVRPCDPKVPGGRPSWLGWLGILRDPSQLTKGKKGWLRFHGPSQNSLRSLKSLNGDHPLSHELCTKRTPASCLRARQYGGARGARGRPGARGARTSPSSSASNYLEEEA